MDYSSVSSTTGLAPGRILSLFPSGNMDPMLNLAPLAGHTQILILAGDSDQTVGTVGVDQLVTQLAASGFPYPDVRFERFARTASSSQTTCRCSKTRPEPATPSGHAPIVSSRPSCRRPS